MNYYSYTFDIGKLYISEEDGIIRSIAHDSFYGIEKETPAIKACATELQEYFDGDLKEFTFQYKQEGTDFQKQVWQALEQVPFGSQVHYKDIAEMIGNPKASQAVGSACGSNQLLIVVPCHRIVPMNKSMGGFRMGKSVKEELLKHEKTHYQPR